MLTTPYTDHFHADTIAGGGATVDLDTHDLREPDARYFVGAGSQTWTHRIKVEYFTPTYLAMLVAVAKREGLRALGTWVKDGYVIIEPTEMYETQEHALNAASLYGEQAYFDAVNRETIYV